MESQQHKSEIRPKILAFAGSLRKDSLNKKMVKIASLGAEAAGGQVTYIDLNDYPLPLYNQDLEESQGIPENAQKLKELMISHDGFLIASPEYNSSISGPLKNVIDWTSRKGSPDEKNLVCFIDKVVVLMSASPGALGGLRGLVHLRAIFGNIYSVVLPQQKSIPYADKEIDEGGDFKEAKLQNEVLDLGKKIVSFLKKYKA